MSGDELAERMGVSKETLQKVEEGDPGVAIGSYIEAAVILGIPLLGGEKEHITNLARMLGYMSQLIPDGERGDSIEVDDDF